MSLQPKACKGKSKRKQQLVRTQNTLREKSQEIESFSFSALAWKLYVCLPVPVAVKGMLSPSHVDARSNTNRHGFGAISIPKDAD